MGVGDTSIPKRIEKMGTLFYGLVDGLGRALEDDAEDNALEAFVLRDVLNENAATHAADLAGYVRRTSNALAGNSTADIMAGTLVWDEPA